MVAFPVFSFKIFFPVFFYRPSGGDSLAHFFGGFLRIPSFGEPGDGKERSFCLGFSKKKAWPVLAYCKS